MRGTDGSGPCPVGKREQWFDKCEELFIIQGRTLTQISEETDVSITTLSGWCDYGDWKTKRAEYATKSENFNQVLKSLKLKLAREAFEASPTNPQLVYALAALLKIEPERRPAGDKEIPDAPREISEETLKKVKEEIYGIFET